MEEVRAYRTDRFLGFVITLMGFAILFSVDIDRLLVFYRDPWSVLIVSFFAVINPLLFLFGFSFQINPHEVIGRSYFLFKKKFKINDLTHVLYQATWRVTSESSSMRTLHIVRFGGGWKDTISLTNGPFQEKDLADIAKRLKNLNPRIIFNSHAETLMKKSS
ncbi:MAG: hypothetical protein A3I38_02445 [Candidatus Wildermuthbacteria bacterium RIFCSPLOWO2_02_FULL_47_10]|uniref:DUF304 domain-containing protein n=1 Tax=Candidatus Wildermuthbacteria bacterium RIFCSPHIGHO2_02_FULL_47_17 TaxID=1802452 RepID=A0A1G2R350_9BACT|nr:MAG: hypothetical protein A3D59_00080 [Candidatus Wildermuthbacteria bacterium RIFCSPHIGHO2_02_FULL_47_17]OHA75192.1 MAG: hypothetical protein A3I38_02445 [Candidatus Wildermuthbacteria bacterium RIFCSPLOWO2_02_FULL_47_10]